MKKLPHEMSREDYIKQEVTEAKKHTKRGTDRGGNRIYCNTAYIERTRQNADTRYSLRGRDIKDKK